MTMRKHSFNSSDQDEAEETNEDNASFAPLGSRKFWYKENSNKKVKNPNTLIKSVKNGKNTDHYEVKSDGTEIPLFSRRQRTVYRASQRNNPNSELPHDADLELSDDETFDPDKFQYEDGSSLDPDLRVHKRNKVGDRKVLYFVYHIEEVLDGEEIKKIKKRITVLSPSQRGVRNHAQAISANHPTIEEDAALEIKPENFRFSNGGKLKPDEIIHKKIKDGRVEYYTQTNRQVFVFKPRKPTGRPRKNSVSTNVSIKRTRATINDHIEEPPKKRQRSDLLTKIQKTNFKNELRALSSDDFNQLLETMRYDCNPNTANEWIQSKFVFLTYDLLTTDQYVQELVRTEEESRTHAEDLFEANPFSVNMIDEDERAVIVKSNDCDNILSELAASPFDLPGSPKPETPNQSQENRVDSPVPPEIEYIEPEEPAIPEENDYYQNNFLQQPDDEQFMETDNYVNGVFPVSPIDENNQEESEDSLFYGPGNENPYENSDRYIYSDPDFFSDTQEKNISESSHQTASVELTEKPKRRKGAHGEDLILTDDLMESYKSKIEKLDSNKFSILLQVAECAEKKMKQKKVVKKLKLDASTIQRIFRGADLPPYSVWCKYPELYKLVEKEQLSREKLTQNAQLEKILKEMSENDFHIFDFFYQQAKKNTLQKQLSYLTECRSVYAMRDFFTKHFSDLMSYSILRTNKAFQEVVENAIKARASKNISPKETRQQSGVFGSQNHLSLFPRTSTATMSTPTLASTQTNVAVNCKS